MVTWLRQSVEQVITVDVATPGIDAVSLSVWGPDGVVIIDEQAAIENAVNTTVSGSAAASGSTTFAITSGSNIVRLGRYYLGGDYDGAGVDYVTVDRLVEPGTVHTVEPLRYTHAVGATFKSPVWSYTLSAANLATLGVYRTEWTWTGGFRGDVFEVVERPLAIPASVQDLTTYVPASRIRAAGIPPEMVLAEAHRRVVSDFRSRRLRPDLVRDASELVPLVGLAANILLAQRWARTEPDVGEMARAQSVDDYQAEWKRVTEGGITWYDRDADGTPDDSEVGGVSARVRLHDRRPIVAGL